MNHRFAIVDLETTGLNPERDRIIEIGVILHDGKGIQSEHHFLINPEIRLKPVIVHLTGISDSDLQSMPLFDEIAQELFDLLDGRVVVGHNIQFDYSFLKKSFSEAGIAYSSKTICTRDLSEFVFPGLRSYSLKSMCRKLKITNEKPHRALSDAKATERLFCALSEKAGAPFIHSQLTGKGSFTLIPAHLKTKVNQELPQTPGVYYFIGARNKPLYIGKANNIRQRVLSHFRGEGNSLKILAFAAGIKDIVFRETGSDVLAYLLEDHEIRHYWPARNHAQKRNRVRFGIESYTDQVGRSRLTITRSVRPRSSHFTFHQYHLAAGFLRNLVIQYELNGPLCGLPDLNLQVSDEAHRIRMQTMMQQEVLKHKISIYFMDDIDPAHRGFIWLENGFYKGFGRIPSSIPEDPATIRNHLTLRFSSVTTEGIVARLQEERSPDLECAGVFEEEGILEDFSQQ